MDEQPEQQQTIGEMPPQKPASEAPRYRSFKIVRALKILHVSEIMCWPAEPGFAPIDLEPGWFTKHQPAPGGYYVMYEDGYASYSPAHPFETGYVAIIDGEGEGAPAEDTPVLNDNSAELRTEMIERIARACHEVNRAYCQSIGDNSQPPWSEAPDWQRKSARLGVAGILEGSITKPEDSHASWMKTKYEDGWKYGAVKNPDTKEHPCLVPYVELPAEQRVKDALFFAVVSSLQ